MKLKSDVACLRKRSIAGAWGFLLYKLRRLYSEKSGKLILGVGRCETYCQSGSESVTPSPRCRHTKAKDLRKLLYPVDPPATRQVSSTDGIFMTTPCTASGGMTTPHLSDIDSTVSATIWFSFTARPARETKLAPVAGVCTKLSRRPCFPYCSEDRTAWLRRRGVGDAG